MLKSSLCDYSDVYKLNKGTTSVGNMAAEGSATNMHIRMYSLKIVLHLLIA